MKGQDPDRRRQQGEQRGECRISRVLDRCEQQLREAQLATLWY